MPSLTLPAALGRLGPLAYRTGDTEIPIPVLAGSIVEAHVADGRWRVSVASPAVIVTVSAPLASGDTRSAFSLLLGAQRFESVFAAAVTAGEDAVALAIDDQRAVAAIAGRQHELPALPGEFPDCEAMFRHYRGSGTREAAPTSPPLSASSPV